MGSEQVRHWETIAPDMTTPPSLTTMLQTHIATVPNRNVFRPHALDGAMLYFHAASGTHVRVENATTQSVRRLAPRVVMFGITNRCNLTCDFCSRDLRRESLWTVASATEVLQGLAEAGTLEVAFGGGEPFAFRGFSELIAELHTSTALALNVTTNGTFLTRDAGFKAYAGRFGQVRISLYDDMPWRDACRVLTFHGQRWGANLLVDGDLLPHLPARLAELAALGCSDVSLLSYVGANPQLHLSTVARSVLAQIIEDSPVACRLSVCFGDSVPTHRLFDGMGAAGDCGAGLDFVSITPDQRMQGCSFHDGGLPASSAAEILQGWRTAQMQLGAPSLRAGCARARKGIPVNGLAAAKPPPIAIWQAFSGNNSGECIMVAKFQTVDDAQAHLATLLPHWDPDKDYPAEWVDMFVKAGVAAPDLNAEWMDAPSELLAIGRSVVAKVYAAEDALWTLRGWAWKQGAQVMAGGVHVHDGLVLLCAVRARDRADAQALAMQPPHTCATVLAHGDVLLAWVPLETEGGLSTLAEARSALLAWAASRPLAVEMTDEEDGSLAALIEVKKHLGEELPRTPRLVVSFYGEGAPEKAQRFAAEVSDANVVRAGGCVVITGRTRWKRLAVHALRQGADVRALDDNQLRLSANLMFPELRNRKGAKSPDFVFDSEGLQARLQASLGRDMRVSVEPLHTRWRYPVVDITLQGQAIEAAMLALEQAAKDAGATLSLWVTEERALAYSVRRLMNEV
jgi:hypothetical protein